VEIEAIGTRVMIKRASAVLKNEGFSELFVRANVKYNPMTKPFLRRYAVNPETCKTTTDDVARGSIRLAKSKLFSNVDNEAKLVAWNGREMMTLDQPYDSKLIATIRSKFEDAIKSGKHIDTNKYNGEVYSEAIRSYSHGGGPIFDFGFTNTRNSKSCEQHISTPSAQRLLRRKLRSNLDKNISQLSYSAEDF